MKSKERKLARKYRLKAWSINKIAKKLNVAKSSVFEWTKDIEVKIIPNIKKSQKIASQAMQEKYKLIRDNAFEEGIKLAKNDEDFRLLAALYWGEGSKGKNSFRFANSDIKMIKKVLELVKKFYNGNIKLTICAYLNNGINETSILKYWKKEIKVAKYKFYEQQISRASQRKHIGKIPYGTANLRIGNTVFLQSVYGAIKFLGD